jgi:signal transduction histidine kinase
MDDSTGRDAPIQASPVGLIAYDRYGQITSANGPPVADRLARSGLDEAHAIGTPVAGLWPQVEPLVARATIESLLGDAPALDLDDDGRDVALLFRPTLDASGRPRGGVCTVIDVTSLLARRLLGTSAEEVMVRFAAGLVRTVESIAQEVAGLAVRPVDAPDTSTRAEMGAISRRLTALSTDLNFYSGRVAPRASAISVNRWIVGFAGSVVGDLQPRVSLIVDTCGGDLRITIGERELEYVLTALVERAVQVLGEQGLLTLSVEVPSDDVPNPAAPFGHVRVSVIDTGASIPLDGRETLTMPFDRFAGDSLRLAAVRRVIARTGGTLSVSSGIEATFVEIDFPLMAREPSNPPLREMERSTGAGGGVRSGPE